MIGCNFSDNEADSEMTSDDNAVIKKVGVRSFGIDDILGHDSVKTSGGQRMSDKRQGQGRSPLDALFTMTTNFESMKQKSGIIEEDYVGCSDDEDIARDSKGWGGGSG